MSRVIHPCLSPLSGTLRVPGDKSISHRAFLFAALAEGESRIDEALFTGDVSATIGCLRALGSNIDITAGKATVDGSGIHGFAAPARALDCVRSGTTMRLLAGILAGQSFSTVLTGDEQLLRRPMQRVIEPLRRMGAEIRDTDGHAPLTVRNRQLHGIDYHLPVASAQVKSALLLAGLSADGPTTVRQPGPARDHTERLLSAMGADIGIDGLDITVRPTQRLAPLATRIPSDISSAAFPLVAATLIAESQIVLVGVGVNPTRTGLLDVLDGMGADIQQQNERIEGGEPVADLLVRSAGLRAATVGGETVVRMIDEFPILAVAATQALGETVVRDARELRVKESDRIGALASELRTLGARIETRPDGFTVCGPTKLHTGVVDSHGDHRLAMALSIAGLIADGPVTIENAECAADSYPNFFEQMQMLGVNDD